MEFMKTLKPKDFIALVLLCILAILRLNNIVILGDQFFALIVGYYFAHRIDGIDKGV
jgi:hypothetical protein